MDTLKLGFYTREQISEATGIDPSASQFARDVRDRLTKEGYTYQWINRRGVEILSRTLTPQMRLKELLTTKLGLNSQVNALDFAWFMTLLYTADGFASMPYLTKEKVMTEHCGHDVSESTLRRWAGKLYETDNAHRTKKGALWHTYLDEDGFKRQEPADPDGDEYKEYCLLRSNALNRIQQEDAESEKAPERSAYGRMLAQLYKEYGCYYWCPEIVLNAMGDDIEELISLINEIVISSP